MSDLTVGLITAVVGALVAAAAGGLIGYASARAQTRRIQRESGLKAQQQAVQDYFHGVYGTEKHGVYENEKWLRTLSERIELSDPTLERAKLRDEAIKRLDDLYALGDDRAQKIDSVEVRAAIDNVNKLSLGLRHEVLTGNLSPNLDDFTKARRALAEVANKRVNAKL
jgi:hypothetical protein